MVKSVHTIIIWWVWSYKLKHVNLFAAKGERSISHKDVFTAGQGNTGTDWIRGWMTATTILDAVKRENHVAQR
jgi:hypothetical protein